MKSYSSRELIHMIQKDGWYLLEVRGSHHHYKHLTKKGKLTIPHPKKDFPRKTVQSILNQAGIEG